MYSHNTPKIVIGKARFQDCKEFRVIGKLFTSYVRKILYLDEWKIQNYYGQQWNRIFQLMTESQAKSLKLDNLNCGKKYTQNSFLIDISRIDFYCLQYLSLYKCNLTNLEAFTSINAPCMRILQLTYNNLLNYQSLYKCSFMLERVYIYIIENVVPDLNNFSRFDQRLEILGLQFNEYGCVVSQDLSFLSKTMYNHYKSIKIKIGFKKRIQQTKVRQTLKQKFSNHFELHRNPHQIRRTLSADREQIRRPSVFDDQHAQNFTPPPQQRIPRQNSSSRFQTPIQKDKKQKDDYDWI